MKHANIRLSCVLLASVTLTGCYVQVEDSNVSLTHQLCAAGVDCLPGGGTDLVLGDLIPPFNVDLGDSGILNNSETTEGPIKFKTELMLNQMVVTTPTTGASFDQVAVAYLQAVLNGDTGCVTPSNCVTIAGYDASTDGPADQIVVFKSSGVNLLDVTDGSHTLSLMVKANGRTPAPATWTASAEFGLSLKSRASYP